MKITIVSVVELLDDGKLRVDYEYDDRSGSVYFRYPPPPSEEDVLNAIRSKLKEELKLMDVAAGLRARLVGREFALERKKR